MINSRMRMWRASAETVGVVAPAPAMQGKRTPGAGSTRRLAPLAPSAHVPATRVPASHRDAKYFAPSGTRGTAPPI